MITLVLARARNGVIGRDGALPWHLPADFKRFKALTTGKPMVMGRKTFDSFTAPLPGRRHIVMTRDRDWQAPGAGTAGSLDEALRLAGDEVSVIGGAQVFRLAEPIADRAEVTVIDRDYDGDASFMLDDTAWCEVAREDHAADGDRPPYSFVTLEKRR